MACARIDRFLKFKKMAKVVDAQNKDDPNYEVCPQSMINYVLKQHALNLSWKVTAFWLYRNSLALKQIN